MLQYASKARKRFVECSFRTGPRVYLVYAGVKKWGIVGIGLMDWDSKMYNILKEQDTLYTLLSRGHTGSEARVIGSIVDFLFAPDNHQAVIDKVRITMCSRKNEQVNRSKVLALKLFEYPSRLSVKASCSRSRSAKV